MFEGHFETFSGLLCPEITIQKSGWLFTYSLLEHSITGLSKPNYWTAFLAAANHDYADNKPTFRKEWNLPITIHRCDLL